MAKNVRRTVGRGNYRPTKSGAGMTKKELQPIDEKIQIQTKTAVTGKSKATGSKAAKRRKSYCARSLGQLKRSSAKTSE